MKGIGDEIRERAEVCAEELLSVLIELADRERGFEGSGAEVTIREALGVLASFRTRRDLDDAGVQELALARSLLEKALMMVADEAARESIGESIAFVGKMRTSAIELMVERDRLGNVPRPVAVVAEDVVLSLGTPALIKGVTIAVPRLLSRELELKRPLSRIEGAGDLSILMADEITEDGDAPAPAPEPQIRSKSRNGDEGERRQIEALARDAMEDLAGLSTLRVLLEDEPWRDAAPFEDRLLSGIDALVSLARPVRHGAAELDLAEALFSYATEWIVPDRGRTFAFALTLCCVASDSALLWVTMGARRADPRALPAYVDALALGSNPAIAQKLLGLMSDDVTRELMMVALTASVRRRVFHAGMMLPLTTHPDSEVAALATRCLVHAPPELAQAALVELSNASSVEVRATAAASMLERGIVQGREILRDVLDTFLRAGGDGEPKRGARIAYRALAILGDPNDANRVWAAARAFTSYREIGFFGHLPHVELLFATMDELDRGERDARAERARAQERALAERGVAAQGSILMEDETPTHLGEELARTAAAIKRITGIAPPTFGAGRYDLPGFTRLWQERGPALHTLAMREGRLRDGEPFTKRLIAAALRAPNTAQGDRRLLAGELALATNGEWRFDVDGWSATQHAFLKMVDEAWR